ncbi:MAG: putative L-carnitine dehydratase [Hyphomonadaceae bacterium]|nr:MAG: putative L-carnitine dehydratase [Hyphomonadaceae bacterium]
MELAGLGPAPFCAMMLADHGAEVIRIDRIGGFIPPFDCLARSRSSIAVNLKSAEGIEIIRELIKSADGVIEGFRPGVCERLGLGPDVLLADNPKLVYGRMTGWGQFGLLAQAAGHDINYIALSGALHTCGRADGQPTPPVNYLGDFGGGGMMLAFGMVSALLAVKNGATGQVIDCAMTDGSALLTAMTWSFYNAGHWQDKTGVNLLDTGAHFYDTYETKDGKWISIGSIEPQFYAQLRKSTGLETNEAFDKQLNRAEWPKMKADLAAIFKQKTCEEWCSIMEGTDVCFAPVLSLAEATQHPHNLERETFIKVGGFTQPAPAPRYSKTKTEAPQPPPKVGSDTMQILSKLGVTQTRIDELIKAGAIA